MKDNAAMHAHPVRHDLPAPTQVCAMCEEGTATLINVHQEFLHGTGDQQRTIKAVVPVWSCDCCELEYLDADGEQAKQEAVYRSMGRLTPSEIKLIRKGAGLNQADFAKKLKVGIASVKRWELGSVIQNEAADESIRQFAADQKASRRREPQFRCSPAFPAHVLSAAKKFSLRHDSSPAALAA
jgi:putative zinc finger/helix-turn-helix YgiT family protein